ncbi:MAG: hypothetical protein ACYDG3_14665 [Bacillati bacterium]
MDLLKRRYGVELVKIKETDQKTADFECHKGGKPICVAELKDIEYYLPSAETGWKIEKSEEPLDGVRILSASRQKDNGPNRVARLIHTAYKQLQHYELPRVLIFLNQDSRVDVLDLKEAIEGQLTYDNDNSSYANTAFSETEAFADIETEKKSIDLYIWIDKGSLIMRSKDKIFLRYPNQIGCDLASQHFKVM